MRRIAGLLVLGICMAALTQTASAAIPVPHRAKTSAYNIVMVGGLTTEQYIDGSWTACIDCGAITISAGPNGSLDYHLTPGFGVKVVSAFVSYIGPKGPYLPMTWNVNQDAASQLTISVNGKLLRLRDGVPYVSAFRPHLAICSTPCSPPN